VNGIDSCHACEDRPSKPAQSSFAPDVPAVAEALPGYQSTLWYALLAPKGTPPAIIDRLQREVSAVLAEEEVRRYMAGAGIEIVGSQPAEFDRFFRHEKEQWAKVIRETGAKVD